MSGRLAERELAGDERFAILGRIGAGCLARAQGKTAEATRGFADAIAAFDAQGMIAQAAAARFRLGELEGGDVGQALVDLARATLLAGSVRTPERFLRILAPAPPSP